MKKIIKSVIRRFLVPDRVPHMLVSLLMVLMSVGIGIVFNSILLGIFFWPLFGLGITLH